MGPLLFVIYINDLLDKLIILPSFLRTTETENEINIEETRLKRDLGLNVGYDLKWSGHADRMVGKANIMLGMLKRTFESRDPGYRKIFMFPS